MLQVALCVFAVFTCAHAQTRNSSLDEYTTSTWQEKPIVSGQGPPTSLIAIGWIRRLLTTVIVPVFGLTGNVISAILLLKTRLRSHPTSIFMLALAITDSICLISAVGMIILPYSWFELLRGSDALCKISEYLMRASGEASSWILACMSVERSIAISMPLKSRSILSRKNNKVVVVCCTAVVGSYFTYALVLYTVAPTGGCVFNYNAHFTAWTRYIVDYGVFILLPGIIILASNIMIIIALVRTKDKFLKEGHGRKDAASSSMFAMLIATSAAYLILKTPYHLYTILVPINGKQGATLGNSINWAAVGLGLVGAAQLMNHGINFYLYVITGREFRKVLASYFCKKMKNNPNELSSMKTVTSIVN